MKIIYDISDISNSDPADYLEKLEAIQRALLVGLQSTAEVERIREIAHTVGREEQLRTWGMLPVLATMEERTGPQIIGTGIHYVNDMVFDFARSLAEQLNHERKSKEQSHAAA